MPEDDRENPFLADYRDQEDRVLIQRAVRGSRAALEELMERHRVFVYNLALRMIMNPEDAEDMTQDILIKVITRLNQFRGESEFRTYLYRIAVRHILRTRKRGAEYQNLSFEIYGRNLDEISSTNPPSVADEYELKVMVQEAKIGCMTGMLLCLDREQRLIYIIGGVLGADHNVGAEYFEITPAAFRQKLSRARKHLHAFMQGQCGLVNPDNPCRCARKTRGFIERGWVDPENIKFFRERTRMVRDYLPAFGNRLDTLPAADHLFREHPMHQPLRPMLDGILRGLNLDELFPGNE